MNNHRGNRWLFVTILLGSFIAIWSALSWAGGPTAEATVGFLDQKFKQYGGGYTMTITAEQKVEYIRIFPVSIAMPQDGKLIVEVAEQKLIESERLPAAEINSKLAALKMAGAVPHQYDIPLTQMNFGWLSNRRGDWRARKTLKKSTGKIRALCEEKLKCVQINAESTANSIDFFVDDELQREKFFKALKHLIGLYQHRKELF